MRTSVNFTSLFELNTKKFIFAIYTILNFPDITGVFTAYPDLLGLSPFSHIHGFTLDLG